MGELATQAGPHGSGYARPPFLIDRLELVLELDPVVTRVEADLDFRRSDRCARHLDLAGEGLTLEEVRLDGHRLAADRCRQTAEGLRLLDAPDRGRLSTRHILRPGRAGDEGLIQLGDALITHCEPEGFRRIAFFPDRPDVLASYRCVLRADPARYPLLLANGRRVSSRLRDDGRLEVAFEDDIPKASYLFALFAGALPAITDTFVGREGRAVPLAVYASDTDLPYCAYGLSVLKAAMAWDEAANGLAYERDALNVVVLRDYPGGAMENPTLNLYASEFFVADPEVSTEEQLRRVASSVAHEYFHEWSGNRVGCRSWPDLTVKEGLTVLRQQLFMEDRFGPDARIDDVLYLRLNQYPEDDGELAHAVRPEGPVIASNLYTRTVYEKGAEILRALRRWLGADRFASVLRTWFREFDGRPAALEDFVRTAEVVTGEDLSDFRGWWRLVGAQAVEAECTPVGPGLYAICLRQAPARRQGVHRALPMAAPVKMIGRGPRGPEAVLRFGTESATFEVSGPPDATPSLFRGLSAPVRLLREHSPRTLEQLALHDDDPVNRWDAAQALARNAILEGVEPGPATDLWLSLFEGLDAEAAARPGDVARLLALPPEILVAPEAAPVPVDRIAAGRRALAAAAAGAHRKRLLRWFEQTAAQAEEDLGARRMHNLALGYLVASGDDESPQFALQQLERSRLMDLQRPALQALVDRGGDARRTGLTLAGQLWAGQPARLDHLFAAQAASTAPDAAAQVADLLDGGGVDFQQATRLKAVVDAFLLNQGAFHDAEGQGYAAVAGVIDRLGSENPRLAARFVKGFAGWRRLDNDRQALVRSALRALLESGRVGREPRARLDALLEMGRAR